MRRKGFAILAMVILLGILSSAGLACGSSAPASEPTPTPTSTPKPPATPTLPATPTPPPTPTPTPTPTKCEAQRDAIQAALYKYHGEKGVWPTEDGKPGDIVWDKLVPAFLYDKPSTDSKCNWQVNSSPEGQVCLLQIC